MDPWTIPSAGLQAYKHRDQIAGIWARVANQLRGEKRIVAVTGMPGVGKTVLLDHLTGKADEKYRLPGKSQDVERGIRRARKLRLLFRVIPGQDSPIRVQGMDELFNARKPIAGVVHVVANGYASVRSSYARERLEAEMSLTAYRRTMLKAEVDDLRSTLAHVRGALQRHKDPFWILVAVNKADLFSSPELLGKAYEHYAVQSAFVEALSLDRSVAAA
jgi:hypothetical protein